MTASMGERLETQRQALLTFRLCTLIVVLIALLGWKLTDRYFDRIDEATISRPVQPLRRRQDEN